MNIPVEVARAQGSHGVKGAPHGVKGAAHGGKGAPHGFKGAAHGIKGGRPKLDLSPEERAQRKRDQQAAYRRRKGIPARGSKRTGWAQEYFDIWGKGPGEPLTAAEFAEREPLWNARLERMRSADDGRKAPASPSPVPSVGRNEPCPCGSGRKFKKCCGR